MHPKGRGRPSAPPEENGVIGALQAFSTRSLIPNPALEGENRSWGFSGRLMGILVFYWFYFPGGQAVGMHGEALAYNETALKQQTGPASQASI